MSIEILTIARVKCSISHDVFLDEELAGCHDRMIMEGVTTRDGVKNVLRERDWYVDGKYGQYCPHCRKLLKK